MEIITPVHLQQLSDSSQVFRLISGNIFIHPRYTRLCPCPLPNGPPRSSPPVRDETRKSANLAKIFRVERHDVESRYAKPLLRSFILYILATFGPNIYARRLPSEKATSKIEENTQTFKENLGISSLHIEF